MRENLTGTGQKEVGHWLLKKMQPTEKSWKTFLLQNADVFVLLIGRGKKNPVVTEKHTL